MIINIVDQMSDADVFGKNFLLIGEEASDPQPVAVGSFELSKPHA